jgi:hypothetical protein
VHVEKKAHAEARDALELVKSKAEELNSQLGSAKEQLVVSQVQLMHLWNRND